jgi:hypothetical protein
MILSKAPDAAESGLDLVTTGVTEDEAELAIATNLKKTLI